MTEAFTAQPSGLLEVRLSLAASEMLDAAGVAVSVATSGQLDNDALQTVCATDQGWAGEARQFDLGEGPSYTAHRTGRPVQVADLEHDDTWPAFAKAATTSGFRAVFAFPLRSGSVGIGALTLYQRVAGELTSEQQADALAVAQFTCDLLSSLHRVHPADELNPVFADGLARTEQASQASGIVSVQLGIPVEAALSVLRAHAFAKELSLADVATRVVEHRLDLSALPD